MGIEANNVYIKTDRGRQALQQRDETLPFVLRRTLIIVDGVADVASLHRKAPLYNDIEESLSILTEQGFITLATQAPTPAEKGGKTKSVEEENPIAMSTKRRLLELIKVELGRPVEQDNKAVVAKLLSRIEQCENNYEQLVEVWGRCLKVIKLTIDINIAKTLKQYGDRILANYSKETHLQ